MLVFSWVRGDVMAALAQEGGGLVRGRHRQRIDDAGAWQLAEVLGEPAEALLGTGKADDGEMQAVAVQRAAQHQRLALAAGAELLGDVEGDPCIRRRRGRED